MDGLLYWLDLAGVAVFAVSGALVAARKRMDIVGFLVVAAVTGIGGGTLRDVLLDRGPVFWIHAPIYLWVTSAAAIATFVVAPHVERRAVVLLWADAVGMALFCVLGARTALEAGAGPEVAILMGTMTATFGGLIRDVVCNETPLLLRREVYATAAAAGAAVLVAARWLGLSVPLATGMGFVLAFAIRGLALTWGLSLPSYRPRAARKP